MKKIAPLVVFFVAAAWTTATSFPFQQERETKSFAVSKGGAFELDTGIGTVVANVWDKNEISVTVENIDAADRQHLSMTQTGNTVRVSFLPSENRSRNNLKFTILLPSEFSADLRTGAGTVKLAEKQSITGRIHVQTGGGAVNIGDVNGDLDAHTGGGSITTGPVAGNANLSAGGGEIRCGFVRGAANLHTGGGSIVMQGAGKDLEVSTGGGNITVEDGGTNTVAETGGGNLAINKLSGKATLRTGGGSISIKNAAGELSASTGGGNLVFSNVNGSIRARTGAGNINAEMNPGNKETSLSSGAGDIDLGLPPSAKATIVARVNSRMPSPVGKTDITSEFGAPEAGETSHEKTFLLNGGGPKILLETNIGKIRIRKTS